MRIQLSDFSMAVKEGGIGLPVLFIHGYPLNNKIWAPQTDYLTDFVRVIAPDLRGHGASESTPVEDLEPQGYSMDLMAEDCAALLDNLNIFHPVVLCGLSMGGYISFAFYRKYPERVKGLVLTATRASADSLDGIKARNAAIRLAKNSGINPIVEASLPKMMAPKTYNQQPVLVHRVHKIMQNISIDGIVGDLIGMKNRPDSTSMLSEIQVPTLIMHGNDDQIIPFEEVETMHNTIPYSELVVLPDAGHLLNLEQPALFNNALRNFLMELPDD